MTRVSMTDVLMTAALAVSQRGTCSRRQVGAVIADSNGALVSWGYNGAVRGLPHCEGHDDYRPCEVSEHAERNAIYNACRRGIAIQGLRMYCTDLPCHGCARAIVQTGIIELTYWREYRLTSGADLLNAAGVQLHKIGWGKEWPGQRVRIDG